MGYIVSALKNHGGPDGVLVAEVKVALVLIGGTAVVKVVNVKGSLVVTVKINVLVTVGASLLQREPPLTATFIFDNNGTNRLALVE